MQLFSQILKLIPRTDFERMVKATGAEYRSKGLSSWSQFVGMLFCQLGRAHSLREIEGGLKSCEGKLARLGIEAPARSSLSYANGHRPWELFEKVFYGLFETVAAKAVGKKKFRFKNKLVSIDSTVIDLCLSMYDWAKFRRTKGAVKLHLLRRVEAIREDTGGILVFITNHHGLGVSTIAAIYKDRWQIELFFKALKQNLKIKTFVGASANAVKTHIWTALISMLLLRYLQLASRFGWSLANLVALLRMNLFTYRDLMAWLDKPCATPPDPQGNPQANLAFA